MRVLALIALLALSIQSAQAQSNRGVSYSTWVVSGNLVTLRYLLPVGVGQSLAGATLPVLTTARLGDYVLRHVAVEASGRDCPAIDQGYDLGRVDPLSVGPDLYGFEILFRCDGSSGLRLHDHALFKVAPGHVDLARIERGSTVARQMFTVDRQELRLPDDVAPPSAGLGRYLSLGVRRVTGGADQYGLLLGLLLLARRWRDVSVAILGLAVGQVISNVQYLSGWTLPREAETGACLGFAVLFMVLTWTTLAHGRARVVAVTAAVTLLLLAAVTAVARGPQPALLLCGAAAITGGALVSMERGAGRRMFWLALGAGLGFVEGLLLLPPFGSLDFTAPALLAVLTSFSLGVLGVQAALLLAGFGGVLLCRRWRLPARALVADLTAAALGGLGAFWLLSRLYA